MKIIELYIESFGKLSGYSYRFSEGLNEILEDNGFGKSTLADFIKAMLYGLDDTRRLSIEENDRKKYFPWQGGSFGGWLSFETGGKKYRIERTFGKKASDDTYAVFDLERGMETSALGECPGETVFGIDKDGFLRTVCLSEKNLSGKNTNQTISAKLSDLVGAEGDMGEFDNALKLLDDRRKFYQKRGGTGGIQDVRTRLSQAEDELRSLKEKKLRLAENDRECAEVTNKILAARREKEELAALEKSIADGKEKKRALAHYKELKDELISMERRALLCSAFFEHKMPTAEELDQAAALKTELSRLEGATAGSYDYSSALKSFFDTPERKSGIAEVKRLSQAISIKNVTLDAFIQNQQEAPPCPFKRLPTEDELAAHTEALSTPRGHSPKRILLIILGFLISIASFTLGFLINPLIHLGSIIGFLTIFVGVFGIFNEREKNKERIASAKKFIEEISIDAQSYRAVQEAIKKLNDDFIKYKSETTAYNASREYINSAKLEIAHDQAELDKALALFDDIEFDGNPTERANYILLLYESSSPFSRMDILTLKRQENGKKIAELEGKLKEFTSYFPTETADPIGEIRVKLREYEIIREGIEKKREELRIFAKSNKIEEGCAIPIPESAELSPENEKLKKRLAEADEALIAAERRKSMLENEYSTLSRELERIDEVEGLITELRETIAVYTENLDTITRAMELLTRAKDNMTARYLAPTKDAFLRYMELIEKTDAEFTMDTDFTLTKLDHGKSRPTEAYSRGTRDLLSLGIRLALIDSLYSEETPPIILDDPFAYFDDTRIESAIALLRKLAEERQIIYFTCSGSRSAK